MVFPEIFGKLAKPFRAVTKWDEFAVSVFAYLLEPVFIVKKDCFIAIGKHLRQRFKTALETAFYIIRGDIMPALFHAVLNAFQAFLNGIQPNIEKADIVSCFFRFFLRCPVQSV